MLASFQPLPVIVWSILHLLSHCDLFNNWNSLIKDIFVVMMIFGHVNSTIDDLQLSAVRKVKPPAIFTIGWRLKNVDHEKRNDITMMQYPTSPYIREYTRLPRVPSSEVQRLTDFSASPTPTVYLFFILQVAVLFFLNTAV